VSAVGFLSGLTLHQVRVGYDLRLMSSDPQWLDENNVEVVLEAPRFVTDPDGTEHRIERGDLGTIPPLLALQSRVISEAPSRSRRSTNTKRGTSRDPAKAQSSAYLAESCSSSRKAQGLFRNTGPAHRGVA